MIKSYLTTFQAAKLLSVSPDTILKWIKLGKVNAYRTPGGHYRIEKVHIENLLPESKNDKKVNNLDSGERRELFKFCWECNKETDEKNCECDDCFFYETRGVRCYQMNSIPQEFGHLRLHCTSRCDDCEYYLIVKNQALNILIITENDARFLKDIANSKSDSEFNFLVASGAYESSAVVEKFRPDYAVIDTSLSEYKIIRDHLTNDSRIPFIRIIYAIESENLYDFCDKKIIAKISKPFTLMRLKRCIRNILK